MKSIVVTSVLWDHTSDTKAATESDDNNKGPGGLSLYFR